MTTTKRGNGGETRRGHKARLQDMASAASFVVSTLRGESSA